MKRHIKRFFGRLHGDRSGVVAILAALTIVGIAGFTGFAVDVGYVYYAVAKLQAASDAAALAGAQDINVGAGGTAIATATSYSAAAGQKNASAAVPATMASGYPKLTCLTSIGISCTGPDSANAVQVKQQATVPLYFGKVLGIGAWQISATATAAARGGATKPADVMLVLDTTGSMNTSDPYCSISGATREDCALAGVRTLLGGTWDASKGKWVGGLAPCSPSLSNCGAVVSGNVANPLDRVGLMVFPGVTNASQLPKEYDCSNSPVPAIAKYNASPVYQIIPLSSDYRTSATAPLTTSSNLVKAARGGASGCQQGIAAVGGVGTFYADAVTAAQAALASSGRPTAQKVIILLSDGDATATASNMPAGRANNQCHQAITAAQAATAAGTWVYTIAYGAPTSATPGSCTGGSGDSPAISACATLQQMASDPKKFYSDRSGGSSSCISAAHSITELNQIFQSIGIDASSPRLLPNTTT